MVITNYEDMWHELFQYKITRLRDIKFKKGVFHVGFIHGKKEPSLDYETVIIRYNSIMFLYEDLLKIKESNNKFKKTSYAQNILTLLISTFSTYLESVFIRLAYNHRIKDLSKEKIVRFLNRFNINLNFIEDSYRAIKELRFFYLFPKFINFQNKDNCKEAFLLFDIFLSEIEPNLWRKIFSKKEGYKDSRNVYIHEKLEHYLFKFEPLDLQSIGTTMIDIAKFLYLVDEVICQKYPDIVLL